jgi:transcriptional regulator with XRE-family HTH domain
MQISLLQVINVLPNSVISRQHCINGRNIGVLVRNQSPTVYRRRLGRKLQKFREAAQIKLDEVAKYLRYNTITVRRMEAGKIGVNPRDARELADLYGVTGEERDELLDLADQQSRQPNMWHSYGNTVSQAFYSYLGLESSASSIKVFENIYVNGLLQTEAYTRALVDGINPNTPEPDREKLVELRQKRMKTLTSDHAPLFIAVLDELVVARVVGGTAVMAAQIHHLLDMSELPNVSLRVVPRSTGAYAGMEGSFFILEFPEEEDLDVVFTEGIVGSFFLERPAIVRAHKKRFDAIVQRSLSPQASRTLLKNTLKEFDL